MPVVSQRLVYPDESALWLKALKRPEVELKCQAADAIDLAQRRHLEGLEKTIEPLLEVLNQPDQPTSVRLAIARALITLGARQAAPSLYEHSQSGNFELRNLIEPALAAWDFQPIRAVWLERLRDPATPQRNLSLAIEGLGTVHEIKAVDSLRDLVVSDRASGPHRLAAARVLGLLRQEGLEADAERLAADVAPRGLPARLAATALLAHHRGDRAVQLLQRLALDNNAAVAAHAASRLLELGPKLLTTSVSSLRTSRDPTLRGLAVEVLVRVPGPESVRLLGELLDDDQPDVRERARRSLVHLAANKELRNAIVAEAVKVLASERWRGVEQATIVLVQLDYKPVCAQLLELLNFQRPEVFMAAAWGLRKLAVPETLPQVLRYVADRHKAIGIAAGQGETSIVMYDYQLAQLNQLLGQQKYLPADPVLRRFIPKMQRGIGGECRAAAVWALGLLHDGRPDPALSAVLEARLNDTRIAIPPEDDRVRRMTAIALGRMKVQSSLPSLRKYYGGEPDMNAADNACGWAIAQLTGTPMSPPHDILVRKRDWFLLSFP